jgi:hypothetical protein
MDNLTLDEIIDGLQNISDAQNDISSYDIQVIEEAILQLEELRDEGAL